MAIDYREVNMQLKATVNQLLYINLLHFKDWGTTFHAKVDNLWGYHQLRPTEDSSKVTAIITPWGLWIIGAFGISIAPSEYQARIWLMKFYRIII